MKRGKKMKRVSVEKIIEILQKTPIGTYQPIGEQDKPRPEPESLFLGDYRVDYEIIRILAKSIHKEIGGKR